MDVRESLNLFLSPFSWQTLVLSLALVGCGQPSKLTQASAPLEDKRCTGVSAIKSRAIVEWEDGRISVESIQDVDSFKAEFMAPQIEKIKRVQFDQFVNIKPSSAQSYAYPPADWVKDWGQKMIELEKVKSPQAFGAPSVKSSAPILVGVVDTFVDTKHEQLQGQIALNLNDIPDNGIDDDNNGYIDDYAGGVFTSVPSKTKTRHEHGTHVSGIIAANPTMGPIRGVAPNARIIPAQFMNDDGAGTLSDSILALNYAVQRGAKIVNASWGGACPNSLASAFKALEEKGVLVVVAAGNDGRDLESSPVYPAAFDLPNQLTVAASTENDFMASFSNSSFSSIHLAAPGVSIWSTTPGDHYLVMDGTSMAAPFVAGAAALLWESKPEASAIEIKKALMFGVDRTPQHEFRVLSKGRLNVFKAYKKLTELN